jgi:acetaldehyde dehydrogenase/alcohol dehydrogenase
MRLFSESPQVSVRGLSLPFLDARKRIAAFPQVAHAIKLAAIPTTAGTGSEVSPAAVISVGQRKVTLVDYSLVPDVAIVDPLLTLTMPPEITADTGIDALTHALEAAVSIFASPFTDAFCVQAVRLILGALPRAFNDGSNIEARTAMSNAATIAGLAFSNAFVGLNHALAHAVGARFGVAHGRANAIFLPHVLRYNASLPTKFMRAPGYAAYVAPEKYAQIAWILSLARWPRPACHARSSRRRSPIWPRPPSATPASAPTRASRWCARSSRCSKRDTRGEAGYAVPTPTGAYADCATGTITRCTRSMSRLE